MKSGMLITNKKKTRGKIDFCGLVKKQILFFTMQNKASCPDFFLKKKIVHVIMRKTAASIIEKIKTMLRTKVYFQALSFTHIRFCSDIQKFPLSKKDKNCVVENFIHQKNGRL